MARATAFPIKKLIGFDAVLWEKVREYRFAAKLNTDSDAVRQLIEVGLTAGAPSGGGKPDAGSSGTATAAKPLRSAS